MNAGTQIHGTTASMAGGQPAATAADGDAARLAQRADVLRRLHTSGGPLILPNAWDVASARSVTQAAFPVVARIARSVSVPVPVTADVEAGYGLPPGELVGRLLDAGAVGCNLEDTDHHGGGGLIAADEQADRLRAVRDAASAAGVRVVLNARIDVLRQEGDRRERFEEAVGRAQLYLQAGADCVFPIGLSDDELIGEFVRRAEGPVNIMGAGAPPLARLADLGVRRVSFAGILFKRTLGVHAETLSGMSAELRNIA